MIYEIKPKYKVGDKVLFGFAIGRIINIRLQKLKDEYWIEYLIGLPNGEKHWECEKRYMQREKEAN